MSAPAPATDDAEKKALVNNHISDQHGNGGTRCPWPFIFSHDPIQGLKDWQTWVVLGGALTGYVLLKLKDRK